MYSMHKEGHVKDIAHTHLHTSRTNVRQQWRRARSQNYDDVVVSHPRFSFYSTSETARPKPTRPQNARPFVSRYAMRSDDAVEGAVVRGRGGHNKDV